MQPLKKNAIYVGTERKMQETEKWADELEEKLSFTVEKFEEQN
jgi:3'-phosphoadenosine 5'-phosphosulfate sulfotransferase (PAPS reductase)/FAD synthetase